jgi:hypothetical protein
MSEMRDSYETEDYIKLKYAETHEGVTTSTWNSPEFKQFRSEQMQKLNKQFTEWMGPDSYGASLYEKQSANKVYQNSEGRNFRRDQLGIKSGLANRLKLWKMEAENEFDSGYGKAYIQMQSGNFTARKFVSPVAGNFHRALYRGLHMVERAGVEMVKYGVSDTKKDLDNPLKLAGKKLFMVPFGATIAAGGAVLKSVANPLYPIQSAKRAWKKKKDSKPKRMTLAQGAREMQEQRDRIRNAPTMLHSQELANAASASRSRGAAFKEQATKILNGESRQPTDVALERTSNGMQIDKGREL